MPAVALDLIHRQRDVLDHGESGLRPLLIAAVQVDDGLVAELFEGLRRQHRPQTGLAVEHHGRRRIAHGGADAELEESAADVRGRLDVAVTVLVRITHVDDDGWGVRLEPACEVLRALLGNDLPRLREHLPQGFHRRDITPIPGRHSIRRPYTGSFVATVRRCYTRKNSCRLPRKASFWPGARAPACIPRRWPSASSSCPFTTSRWSTTRWPR